MSFESLALNASICQSVAESGYTTPTAIQERAIPLAIDGKDILASAQTGTGKTAAFILPILQRLSAPSAIPQSRGARALVLTPTRELAQQVSDCARRYGKHISGLSVVSIVGGVPYQRQRAKMKKPVDIIVATPGRLMDYLRQGQLDFKRIETLVLDEADRMLDMGFREDVLAIAKALPTSRQTLLFSATIDQSIETMAQKLLKEPVRIEVTPQKTKHESIAQKIHYVSDLGSKRRLLTTLLRDTSVGQAIIFTATKRSADQLTYQLRDEGFAAAALHGDLRQRQRMRTITELQDGELQFLVATDIAARGIDIRAVSHIFNFDLPRANEDYVHRIGRTGRAGEKGTAVSIAYHYEKRQVRRLESFLGHSIEVLAVPGVSEESAPEQDVEGHEAEPGRQARSSRNERNGRSNGRRNFRGGGFRNGRAGRGGDAPRGDNQRGGNRYGEDRSGGSPRRDNRHGGHNRGESHHSEAPRSGEVHYQDSSRGREGFRTQRSSGQGARTGGRHRTGQRRDGQRRDGQHRDGQQSNIQRSERPYAGRSNRSNERRGGAQRTRSGGRSGRAHRSNERADSATPSIS